MIHLNYSGETRNPIGSVASLDMIICVGFGMAVAVHKGKIVVDGERPPKRLQNREGYITLRAVERLARRDPRGGWSVELRAPLWDAKWVRRRPGKWICVEAGRGFA